MTKVILLAHVGVFFAVLVLILSCSANSRHISFQTAMRGDTKLQEKFISQVIEDIGGFPRYVTGVTYADTPKEVEFLKNTYGYEPQLGHLMYTAGPKIEVSQFGKQQWPATISVFPESFSGNTIRTDADFKSSLLHMIRNAETRNLGRINGFSYYPTFFTVLGDWNGDLARTVEELDALRLEFRRRDISQEYFQTRAQGYLQHYFGLCRYAHAMEPKLIESLKVEFFHAGMLTHSFFFRESNGREEGWYLKHPVGEEKCRFSPREIEEIQKKLTSGG